MTSIGSVTKRIRDLAMGIQRDDATRMLWERFSEEVAAYAARKLWALRGPRRISDETDASSWAFAKVCRGIEGGRLELAGRIDFQKLLLRTTERELKRQIRREKALKRGGDRVIVTGAEAEEVGLLSHPGGGGDPAIALMATEGCRRLLDLLDSEDLRAVARWKLIGYANAEVATRLGVSVPTVEFMLRRIRARWAEEVGNLRAKPGPRAACVVPDEPVVGPGVGPPDDISVILALLVGSIVAEL